MNNINSRKVRASFKCSGKFKDEFVQSSCLLTISVGQATHEDEMFAATIDLVNKSFTSCTILIGDSLQRHNISLNSTKDADFFHDIAVKEGDLWLERNIKYINKLSIPYQIFRWDRFLHHPDLKSNLDKIKATLDSDPNYRIIFNNCIEKFVKKQRKRFPDLKLTDLEKVRQFSHNYLVEECAAINLWPELQCNFEAYPIGHCETLNMTREYFVLPKYPNLLRALTIKFKNAKPIKPQSFLFKSE